MTKQRASRHKQVALVLSVIAAAIFVLLPFHAVFTTWLGSEFGVIDWFRIWKEILIVGLAAGVSYLLVTDKKLRSTFFYSFLAQLIALYVVYSLLRGSNALINGSVNGEAFAYGLIINLRYLVFFIAVWIVAKKSDLLYRKWLQLLLGPALAVVLFGLFQQLLLEKDVLRHVGYGKDTIPAFQAVDNKPEYARLQSTLRGPNPLGAYLVLVTTTLAGIFLRPGKRFLVAVSGVAALFVLFFTYSRSAWVGLAISIVVLLLISNISKRSRMILLSVVLAGTLVVAGGTYVLRDNDYVQNTVFHSDESSLSARSSNEARYGALERGVRDVVDDPFGKGVGTAGPASMRNSEQAPRIAENYYVQLAQEVGVIGLLLYIVVSFMVAKELWWRRNNELLARVLLASFIGITAINFVSHAWTDDTLSLLWWGLAGVAIARPVILKHNQYDKKGKTKTQ